MGVVTIQNHAGNRIRAPGSVFRSGTFFSENQKKCFSRFFLYVSLYSIKGRAPVGKELQGDLGKLVGASRGKNKFSFQFGERGVKLGL